MFNFGTLSEFLIIAIAALILIGPKELPQILHTCGRWFYRLKNLTAKVQKILDQALESGQLAEMQEQARDRALKEMPQIQGDGASSNMPKSDQCSVVKDKGKDEDHVA